MSPLENRESAPGAAPGIPGFPADPGFPQVRGGRGSHGRGLQARSSSRSFPAQVREDPALFHGMFSGKSRDLAVFGVGSFPNVREFLGFSGNSGLGTAGDRDLRLGFPGFIPKNSPNSRCFSSGSPGPSLPLELEELQETEISFVSVFPRKNRKFRGIWEGPGGFGSRILPGMRIPGCGSGAGSAPPSFPKLSRENSRVPRSPKSLELEKKEESPSFPRVWNVPNPILSIPRFSIFNPSGIWDNPELPLLSWGWEIFGKGPEYSVGKFPTFPSFPVFLFPVKRRRRLPDGIPEIPRTPTFPPILGAGKPGIPLENREWHPGKTSGFPLEFSEPPLSLEKRGRGAAPVGWNPWEEGSEMSQEFLNFGIKRWRIPGKFPAGIGAAPGIFGVFFFWYFYPNFFWSFLWI